MARWGKFDFSEFEKLTKAFQTTLDERVIERFIRVFLMEMAMRSLRKIKKRTPVGETGDLRNGWQIGRIEKRGNTYHVEIYNNTYYASFVEYGHRTGKDLTGWVDGRFMLTISMQEIERELPKYLEKRVVELLNDIMNGRPPRKE
ncbi:HK97 gp10 family phage protein [Brevibacillus sp. M2.1A]|uniref:HK97 gp10 family phage protein n=1 Tax=Brevibacillus sp. M2.1A TaxID=2738980 RepID=UPI00156A826A|nr:HK97 gp10 family phage protein [Brevibacillus sp. M2.1A]MCC8435477.1 HK97 gp10 family phage protein [Brevibacillus sp. M2.1A]